MDNSVNLGYPDRSVSLGQLKEYADLLGDLTTELRKQIISPEPKKKPPTFTSSQVAELCGIDRQRLNYLITKNELPEGEARGSGRSRLFTLADTRKWVQAESGIVARPEGSKGAILLCSNFKGGSAKTTTAMCLAQGLSLLGRKVLVVDLDPQASLTELCGVNTEKGVHEEDTVLPFIQDGEPSSLRAVIRQTYWDGVDVIASHPSLFAAEFIIPSLVNENPDARFWRILSSGLEPLREEYDYIVMDSAPSLSYLTINALMATDAIIMPLVPESLDFMSSVSFWSLFSDLAESFAERGDNKRYDFISVLLSKVDNSPHSSSWVVRSWANQAYGDWVESVEIPLSSVMSNGALAISTVFDVGQWGGDKRTLDRIKEPFERYCKQIDDLYSRRWMQK